MTQQLQALYDEGYRCIAIIFLHSYTFAEHERRAAEIARNMGFEHVSVSSELQPMIRAVSRSNSTTADAYLTPEIKRYLANFSKGFKGGLKDDTGCRVSFMQSDGALVDIKGFSGLRAVLSGPAGGVVGFSRSTWFTALPCVGFQGCQTLIEPLAKLRTMSQMARPWLDSTSVAPRPMFLALVAVWSMCLSRPQPASQSKVSAVNRVAAFIS